MRASWVLSTRTDGRQAPRGPQAGRDVDALPGGAAGALEAVLMVVDEPVAEVALASALGLTRGAGRASCWRDARGRVRRATGAASSCARSRRLAVLQPRGVRRRRRALRARRPAARLTQAALETLASWPTASR